MLWRPLSPPADARNIPLSFNVNHTPKNRAIELVDRAFVKVWFSRNKPGSIFKQTAGTCRLRTRAWLIETAFLAVGAAALVMLAHLLLPASTVVSVVGRFLPMPEEGMLLEVVKYSPFTLLVIATVFAFPKYIDRSFPGVTIIALARGSRNALKRAGTSGLLRSLEEALAASGGESEQSEHAVLLTAGTRLLGEVAATKGQLAAEESPKFDQWKKREADLIQLLYILGCQLGEINQEDTWQRTGFR